MSLMDRYRKAWREDPAAVARWEAGTQFVEVGPNGKVACTEPGCLGDGWPGEQTPAPWQHAHLLGHSSCACGRRFPLRWDSTPRVHGHHRHTCPATQATDLPTVGG